MSLAEVLKERRKELDLTLAEVAKRVGVSEATVQRWESGNIKNLRHDRIGRLAEALNVPPSRLMGWTTEEKPKPTIPPGFEPMPEMVSVPVIGAIACGRPITAEQNIEEYINIPAHWNASFVLRCQGDSMAPKIQHGDIVAIRQQEIVENGQVAAVLIGDEATLKRVYRYPDRLELRPINPDFEPIVLWREEMNTAKVEGRAVGICRDII